VGIKAESMPNGSNNPHILPATPRHADGPLPICALSQSLRGLDIDEQPDVPALSPAHIVSMRLAASCTVEISSTMGKFTTSTRAAATNAISAAKNAVRRPLTRTHHDFARQHGICEIAATAARASSFAPARGVLQVERNRVGSAAAASETIPGAIPERTICLRISMQAPMILYFSATLP